MSQLFGSLVVALVAALANQSLAAPLSSEDACMREAFSAIKIGYNSDAPLLADYGRQIGVMHPELENKGPSVLSAVSVPIEDEGMKDERAGVVVRVICDKYMQMIAQSYKETIKCPGHLKELANRTTQAERMDYIIGTFDQNFNSLQADYKDGIRACYVSSNQLHFANGYWFAEV